MADKILEEVAGGMVLARERGEMECGDLLFKLELIDRKPYFYLYSDETDDWVAMPPQYDAALLEAYAGALTAAAAQARSIAVEADAAWLRKYSPDELDELRKLWLDTEHGGEDKAKYGHGRESDDDTAHRFIEFLKGYE